ncbi:ubiquitin-conjugating enzyme E2 S-B [Cladochytrium replicatum]|nr:ubiquitin-conjugating enzyme E2 S-B [Cladochytrium replicatum]
MSSNENLNPAVLRRLIAELQGLQNDPPEGIQVILNEANVLDVQAWILGPGKDRYIGTGATLPNFDLLILTDGTPYEKGCFKVKLVLGSDFPASPPKGYFLTTIFHPNVAKDGEICVNTLKRDWKSNFGITHILLTIKCLLIVPNPESALNDEAGKRLLDDYEDYAKHARLMTSIHAKKVRVEFKNLPAPTEPAITFTEPGSLMATDTALCELKNSDSNLPSKFEAAAAAVSSGTTKASATSETVSSNGSMSPKKRVADRKSEKPTSDKKRTLRRL